MQLLSLGVQQHSPSLVLSLILVQIYLILELSDIKLHTVPVMQTVKGLLKREQEEWFTSRKETDLKITL